jgi:hypothetical protein
MNIDFQTIINQYLPLLIPVLLLQLGLQTYCIIDLVRRERVSGSKWIWAPVILLFQFIGCIIYLLAGRKE